MPKRSSSRKPSSDPVQSAYDTIQHIIAGADPERQETVRIRELERVCREVAEFARVGGLPERVIAVLDRVGSGGAVDPAYLLPITPEDFPNESPAVALGRAGGLKGGKARANALSSRRRREIAKKAARTRWQIASPKRTEPDK
jgi:hypothetical protein